MNSPSVKRGLSYEARVGRHVRPLVDSLGWELWDHKWLVLPNGSQCQPDFVILAPAGAIILEAKLTWIPTPEQRKKYLAALRALNITAIYVLVCRNLNPQASNIVSEWEDLLPDCTWHLWI